MIADKKIERLIDEERWSDARQIIEQELKKTPKSHWLLDRLSVTYYEERDYARALRFAKKAHSIAPKCPLVLWDYAGALTALERTPEALKLYGQIINSLPEGGLQDHLCARKTTQKWKVSIVVDCFFRVGHCFKNLGDRQSAKWFFEKYIGFRERHQDLDSIYTIEDAEKALHAIDDVDDNEFDIEFEVRQANGILAGCR